MLPVAPQSPPAPQLALIVEDHAQFTQRLAEAFGALEAPWHLEAYHTGADAIAALQGMSTPPGLVLVDLGLPDMSGHEVIEVSRLCWPEAPVLVISVLTSAEAVLRAVRLGARGYLHKGESVRALSAAIDGVLAGEYPISPSLARHLFRLARLEALPDESEDDSLSPREVTLLRLLGQGYTYAEAARLMDVTIHTVRTFSRRIYQKLAVHSKREALDSARERGLLA
jgi:DNA-binding NarL/FixJ family response regulator